MNLVSRCQPDRPVVNDVGEVLVWGDSLLSEGQTVRMRLFCYVQSAVLHAG